MLVRITPFSGEQRAVDPHLLEAGLADYARDVDVRSGALRAIRGPRRVVQLSGSGDRTVPVLDSAGVRYWVRFADPLASVVSGVTRNDSYERVYVTQPGQKPQYAPLSTLTSGGTLHELGITPPATAPGVTATGGTGTTVTRSYVYTWLTTYGEESAPSPPTIVTAPEDATWDITLPASYSGLNSPVDRIALYRSSVGTTLGDYRLVATLSLGTTSYTDGISDYDLAFALALEAYDWQPPPDDLGLLVRHSSGAVVGASGTNVKFSVPWQPHAWPTAYTFTLPSPPTALAAVGETVVAFTTGRPWLFSGPHPGTLSIVQLPTPVPVMQPQAVLVARGSVLAVTPSGIAQFVGDRFEPVATEFLRPDQWDQFQPADFRLSSHRGMVVCRLSATRSLAFMTRPGGTVVTELTDPALADELVYDPAWDRTYLRYGNDLYELDASVSAARRYIWRSKVVTVPRPANFGVLRIVASLEPDTVDLLDQGDVAIPDDTPGTDPLLDWKQAYNEDRWAQGALAPIASHPIAAPVWPFTSTPLALPPLAPIAASPLFETVEDSSGSTTSTTSDDPPRVTVQAGGRTVATCTASTGTKICRLPGGFRHDRWRVLVEGGRDPKIVAIELAEAIDELVTA